MYGAVTISTANELVRINASRLVYVASDGNYSTMVLHDRTEQLFTLNLGAVQGIIEKQLGDNASFFIRIGKCLIINKDYVYKINPNKQMLILSDGAHNAAFTLSASKEALRQLKQLFEKESAL